MLPAVLVDSSVSQDIFVTCQRLGRFSVHMVRNSLFDISIPSLKVRLMLYTSELQRVSRAFAQSCPGDFIFLLQIGEGRAPFLLPHQTIEISSISSISAVLSHLLCCSARHEEGVALSPESTIALLQCVSDSEEWKSVDSPLIENLLVEEGLTLLQLLMQTELPPSLADYRPPIDSFLQQDLFIED